MTQPNRLDPLRQVFAPLLAMHEARGLPTPECLDDAVTSALVDGTLDAATQERAIGHIATCARCRAAVASVAKAIADPGIRREMSDSSRRGGGRFVRLALPLAVAAGLLLVLWLPKPAGDGARPHRGDPSQRAPVAVAPQGVVAEARVLRWQAVVGADRYRVTVFDAESRVVFAGEVDDTTLKLPDSTVVRPGQRYAWIVEARTGYARWSASEPATFMVTRGVP